MALAKLAAARLEGDFDRALDAADELLADSGDLGDGACQALVHALLGEAALWGRRSDRARQELERAVTLARVHRLDFLAVSALSHLALLDACDRGPADAGRHAAAAIELATKRGWSLIPQTASAHAARALRAFDDRRPVEAAEHLERARAAAERYSRRQLDLVLTRLEAELAGAPGDGLRALGEFEARHRRTGESSLHERASLAALRARLLLACGDLDAADAAIAGVRGEPWVVVDVADARLCLASGRPADAAELLTAAADHRVTQAVDGVERAVLAAVAHADTGDSRLAGQALEDALQLAADTGHRRPFLDLGRRVEELLRERIRVGTAHRAVVAELLDMFADRTPAARDVAPLLDPLSEREQTILRYLPTAMSNREIADELYVTTNTIKTHLRSIYRKLDVARRREAVERARELRLLSAGGLARR